MPLANWYGRTFHGSGGNTIIAPLATEFETPSGEMLHSNEIISNYLGEGVTEETFPIQNTTYAVHATVNPGGLQQMWVENYASFDENPTFTPPPGAREVVGSSSSQNNSTNNMLSQFENWLSGLLGGSGTGGTSGGSPEIVTGTSSKPNYLKYLIYIIAAVIIIVILYMLFRGHGSGGGKA